MSKESYRRTVTRAGQTVTIRETYPTQFGDKLTRKHRTAESATPEAMQKYNEELAIERLALLLNENFSPEDLWMTLTYEKDNRPQNYEDACKVLSGFVRKIRQLFVEAKVELKYVKCTAFGSRGAVHHHLVIPAGVPQRELTKAWKEHIRAGINARPPTYVALYSTGEYSSIAAYIIRQGRGDQEGEKYVKKWVGSRNLIRPQPERDERINKIKWQEPPTPWAGYYVDTDTVRAGTNPITGRPYLSYRMVKLPPNFQCYDHAGKRLTGREAVAWYRAQNKEYIREHWIDLNPEGEIVFKNQQKGVKINE